MNIKVFYWVVCFFDEVFIYITRYFFIFWCKIYNLPFVILSQLFLLQPVSYFFQVTKYLTFLDWQFTFCLTLYCLFRDITKKIFTLFFHVFTIDAIPSTIVTTVRDNITWIWYFYLLFYTLFENLFDTVLQYIFQFFIIFFVMKSRIAAF